MSKKNLKEILIVKAFFKIWNKAASTLFESTLHKFVLQDFLSSRVHSKLWICSHLVRKSIFFSFWALQ